MAEEMKEVYAVYCRNHDDAISLMEKVKNLLFKYYFLQVSNCLNPRAYMFYRLASVNNAATFMSRSVETLAVFRDICLFSLLLNAVFNQESCLQYKGNPLKLRCGIQERVAFALNSHLFKLVLSTIVGYIVMCDIFYFNHTSFVYLQYEDVPEIQEAFAKCLDKIR